MNLLKSTLKEITGPNTLIMEETQKIWDGFLKPMGALGSLEDISVKISGMTGKVRNKIDKRGIVVMAADNGVVEEGVSAVPANFTVLLTESMLKGITGLSALCNFAKADIITVDIGLFENIEDKNLINRKIAYGTKNFTKGPAMTYEEVIKAIEVGIEIGDKLYEEGYDILGTGELGIGNTTTSAAVLSGLTNLDVDITCGKGAGLTEEQYAGKKATIVKGIELNKPNKEDPIDVLSKVGGFDIAGMCGLYLSAAKNKKPIVIDGFISSAAALCAVRIEPLVINYIIPSHLSDEPGAKYLMEELKLKPMLNMGMRLGEGTGCPLAFQIIEAALYTLDNMGTYEEGSMSSETLIDIRK